jgi:iron complex outermembrane receptor protein
MNNRTNFKHAALLACTSSLALASTPAIAQSEGRGETVGIEDIVVSARRVDERLQNVPVAVTALSDKMIDGLGARSATSLNAIVPNVTMAPIPGNPGANVAKIRGIGTADPNSALDPAVGFYIDGVYIGRMAAANTELVDVSRIEVLRGPQGTLFGRNTTGGAISIVTRAPSEEFGFEQRVGYAELNEIYARTRISTGNLGNTGLSATATYMHRQRNGEVNDPAKPGRLDAGAQNVDAVWARIQGQWGKFTLNYSFDYTDARSSPQAFQIRYASDRFRNYYGASPGLGGTEVVIDPDGRRGTLSFGAAPRQRIKSHGHTVTAELAVSELLTIKSISAYRKFKKLGTLNYGPDGLIGMTATGPQPAVVNASRPNQYQDQKSQELQAFGTEGELRYLLGLYYFEEDAGEEGLTRFTSLGANGLGTPINSRSQFSVKAKSKAAFGQLTYRPHFAGDKLELAVGLRYSKDEKLFVQTLSTARSGQADFDDLSYNLTASYQWTPDVLTFARMGTGYRSGGFNTRAAATASTLFRPEKAKVYELGLKSDLFDRRARFNVTLFYTKYDDLQVSQFAGVTANGTQGLTLNANADYKGAEAELLLQPIDGLTIYSNVGYTDSQYKQIFFPNPVTGVLENYADQSYFGYTAKWTVANGISYSMDAGIGELTARLDHRYTSRRRFSTNSLPAFSPFNEQLSSPGHSVVDGRITLSDFDLGKSLKGEVSFWVENLFNKEYILSSIDLVPSLGFAGSVYGMPRRVGVEFKVQM